MSRIIKAITFSLLLSICSYGVAFSQETTLQQLYTIPGDMQNGPVDVKYTFTYSFRKESLGSKYKLVLYIKTKAEPTITTGDFRYKYRGKVYTHNQLSSADGRQMEGFRDIRIGATDLMIHVAGPSLDQMVRFETAIGRKEIAEIGKDQSALGYTLQFRNLLNFYASNDGTVQSRINNYLNKSTASSTSTAGVNSNPVKATGGNTSGGNAAARPSQPSVAPSQPNNKPSTPTGTETYNNYLAQQQALADARAQKAEAVGQLIEVGFQFGSELIAGINRRKAEKEEKLRREEERAQKEREEKQREEREKKEQRILFYEKLVNEYTKAANERNLYARDQLAYAYYRLGDTSKAEILWQTSKTRYTPAALNLMQFLKDRQVDNPNQYLKELARNQHPYGMKAYAKVLLKEEPIEATYYLEKLAELGDVEAMYDLGCYYKGIKGSDRVDYVKAMEWFNKAIEYTEEASLDAANELLDMYVKGLGVPKENKVPEGLVGRRAILEADLKLMRHYQTEYVFAKGYDKKTGNYYITPVFKVFFERNKLKTFKPPVKLNEFLAPENFRVTDEDLAPIVAQLRDLAKNDDIEIGDDVLSLGFSNSDPYLVQVKREEELAEFEYYNKYQLDNSYRKVEIKPVKYYGADYEKLRNNIYGYVRDETTRFACAVKKFEEYEKFLSMKWGATKEEHENLFPTEAKEILTKSNKYEVSKNVIRYNNNVIIGNGKVTYYFIDNKLADGSSRSYSYVGGSTKVFNQIVNELKECLPKGSYNLFSDGKSIRITHPSEAYILRIALVGNSSNPFVEMTYYKDNEFFR
ncbi:MAG: tetratricopeptide repeat protein [Rufibacter sp.]